MKKLILLFCALAFSLTALAQHGLIVLVKDAETKEPLVGATVIIKDLKKTLSTDAQGQVSFADIPQGIHSIEYRYAGYSPKTETVSIPPAQAGPLLILLTATEGEKLEEVTVTSTRSSRTIANTPTRVEVISGEELEEKGNMKPGDIRMMLAESTGIQTQQTSATSGNAAIRIQGLDGKYTQIIRDGFPLYSGFSGGLGLLQIAPLDLKQVEVIKGSSSTLYGGGAIAGLVNLISKKPADDRELSFLLNGTSAKGLDASLFYSQKFHKVGTTIYAAYNHGSPFDPSSIGLTAIPRFNRYTLNPKLWLYLNKQTTLNIGINASVENRIGGDINYLKGRGSQQAYFEENKTGRYSSQLQLEHQINEREKLTFKNSLSYFDRSITLPEYKFSGLQLASYTEANYTRNGEKADWATGLNFLTDHFGEDKNKTSPLRSYTYNTIGGFVQNTLNIRENVTLETGLRGDYHYNYGFLLLPRLSTLWKINEHFSTRLGGGLGYKAPTVFTEDAERIQFRNVLPLDVANMRAERSYGANFDLNYRTPLFSGKMGLSINQLFFYTRIKDPILLTAVANGDLQYQQPAGNLNTKGTETNVKLTYGDFKLFVGYTFADVKQKTGNTSSPYPLVSRHRLNNVLMYELEDKWKIGAEAYYFSPQRLNDGAKGSGYWTAGLMAEKIWERFSLFVNFENITDTRQTKFDTIYRGSISNPVFRDIYAPLDGFVVNGGLKFRLP